ncbi:hypothetical protein SAMN05216227_1001148 [Pseudorhodobacter antarcticus]|uniref:Peptidase M15 n=1 Tax=Pseudorhodobacter antarcticus TaxID=1077947 RepID=A0A1H8AIN7_9RHOB|nr:hypothetical protein [Pseudorhodobacter antarcticus]SEM70403.1 hypothetical protein SAMN05216227_1001148 [Pseudorhodobacter antarcticus]
MRAITSYDTLERLGRVRLSQHFYARDFLYSEIGNVHAIPNLPGDVDLFVAAGAAFCTQLLDPLVETFGPIAVRSAYRSPTVNGFGNAHNLKCARNDANHAGHIWDNRDAAGRMGACVSIVVPWFADQYAQGRDWRDLAWWVHDHLPHHEMWFFPINAAFNLTWRDAPARVISSYVAPRGKLLAAGADPVETLVQRRARYADFPPFRGIAYPPLPAQWAKPKDI